MSFPETPLFVQYQDLRATFGHAEAHPSPFYPLPLTETSSFLSLPLLRGTSPFYFPSPYDGIPFFLSPPPFTGEG